MNNRWSVVFVGIVALMIGSLFSKPQETEASKPMSSYSNTLTGLNEIEQRLSLLASNLEKQQSTKFEKAAAEDVAEVVSTPSSCGSCGDYVISCGDYATKSDLSQLRAELMAEIENRIPKPVVQAVQSAPTVARGSSVKSSYSARWTYPTATIEEHMAGDHGVSTAGKTTEQLLAEHDAIHDSIGPVHSTRSSSVTRSRATYSSCPGGVCPTPQSRSAAPVNRIRIFRR